MPLIVWNLLIGALSIPDLSISDFFSLWFLWSIFLCTIITIVMDRLVCNRKLQIVMFTIIVILLHCIEMNPFNIGYMLPFFVLGYYIPEIRLGVSKRLLSRINIISFAIFIILECFWRGEYNIWNVGTYVLKDTFHVLPIIFMRGIIGLSGCITMKLLFDSLFKVIKEKGKHFFIMIGQNTMLLYILQSIVIEKVLSRLIFFFSQILGQNIFVKNIKLLGYVLAPSIAIIVIIGLLHVIKFIKKSPMISNLLVGTKLIK